jgi:CRISPR-associated protein Cas2
MRTRYIVTYDIADAKRLRRVYKTMQGAGTHLQLSVFRCDLTDRQRETLKLGLAEIITPSEDQVLFIELGPSESRSAERIVALGKPYSEPSPGPVIL